MVFLHFKISCVALGGSAIQTVGDNPVTAYVNVQQYAKNAKGEVVSPEIAVKRQKMF